MGFSISWLASKGIGKAQFLAQFGLRDTGSVDEANETPFSCAALPAGWTVLFCNDFDFASPEHLLKLFSSHPILSCQVHEGIMYSAARFHTAGKQTWSVSHFSENGLYDLAIEGMPPPELNAIRDAQIAKQKQQPPNRVMFVDYIWDVPVELAKSLCGYRHDAVKYDWGTPVFTRAERG